MVDLVAHQPDPGLLAPPGDRGQLGRVDRGAGRVRRRGDEDAGHRPRHGLELLEGRLEPRLGAALDLDDLAPEGSEHVAVAGIARPGHHHPVTRLEGGQERQQEAPGRAGGDHDVVCLDGNAVATMVRRHRLPQRGHSGRHRVAEGVRVEQPLGLLAHRVGRARRGLTGHQVEYVAVAGLAPLYGEQQVHDMERRHVRALRHLEPTGLEGDTGHGPEPATDPERVGSAPRVRDDEGKENLKAIYVEAPDM